MTCDFHARFPFFLQDGVTQALAAPWLAGETGGLPPGWPDLALLEDPIARFDVLAQSILTPHRERARSGTRAQSGGYRRWVAQEARAFIEQRRAWMLRLGLEPALPDLARFPHGAWALRIPFTLRQAYLSRDDQTFHLLDNPLKKEWVFKAPYLAASGWKGALRSAMRQMRGYDKLEDKARDEQMLRLFGNVKGEETAFVAGRLHFFPAFFDRLGLEVINPHDRVKGVGERGPILFECAPVGAKGTFMLLYVPLGAKVSAEEIAIDLEEVARGIREMLINYGFGAKTSSGFGVAEEALADDGRLAIAANLPMETSAVQPATTSPPDLPRYLEAPGRLHPDFRREDGTLKSEEEYQALITQRGQKYGKQDKQLYAKARKWWEQEGKAQAAPEPQAPEPSSTPPSPPRVTEYAFRSLSELTERARAVALALRAGNP